MKLIEKLTSTKWGRAVLGGIGIAVLVFVVFQVFGFWRPSEAAAIANDRIFVCQETGKPFHATISPGMTFPIHSPFSGKNSGYPAELCYWTADGQSKTEPTAVILNSWLGIAGPTFCPDCGRLVKGHNPLPGPDVSPPPTREEYESRHGRSR